MAYEKPPCFYCKTEDRYFACQDSCEKKLEWNEKVKKKREDRHNFLSSNYELKMIRDSIKRHRKK